MIPALLGIAAVLLILVGGLLAALDAALSSRSRAELLELAEEREPRRAAAMLRRIADDLDPHRSAVNFLRVVTETTAAVLVTLAFVMLLPEWWQALLVAAVLMIGVSFVLVGASPRSVGRTRASSLLPFAAPLIRLVRTILGPFAVGLIALADRVTPGRVRASALSSEEQLLHLVDEAAEQAVLEQDDRALIHSVLAFDDTLLREVMVPRTDMVVIEADAPLDAALDRFFAAGVSRLPVIGADVDDVLGVLNLRDVARHGLRRSADLAATRVRALLRPVQFLPESQKADEALRALQRASGQLALVVDEYGGIAGLVTLEDLIEELVGEIGDEYDREERDAEPIGPERWRVSARLPVDELGALYGIELDDEEVDTVGGLLGKALGMLPKAGDRAAVHGLLLTAERTEGRSRRLLSVLVEPDPAAAPGQAEQSAEAKPARSRSGQKRAKAAADPGEAVAGG